MTLILDIPQKLQKELLAKAAESGLSVEAYALSLLKDAAAPRPKTGAELVAYLKREGLLGFRKDIKDSQKHARKLRKQATKRSHE